MIEKETLDKMLSYQADICSGPLTYMQFLLYSIYEYAEYYCKENDIDYCSKDSAVAQSFDKDDWEYILDNIKSLTAKRWVYCYNMYPEHLGSLYGYIRLLHDVRLASENKKPSLILKCHACNNDFTIYKKDVLFYANNNLRLPILCKYCQKRDMLTKRAIMLYKVAH